MMATRTTHFALAAAAPAGGATPGPGRPPRAAEEVLNFPVGWRFCERE